MDSSELITASQIEIAEWNLKKVQEAYALSLKQIELAKERLSCKSTPELDKASNTKNVDSTEKTKTDLESYKIQRKSNNPSKNMATNINVSPKTSITDNDKCISETKSRFNQIHLFRFQCYIHPSENKTE